jgi:hypothetical protein
MIRLNFWCLMLIDLAGLGLLIFILVKSLMPAPDMSGMALPFIAIPTGIAAILLIGFILALGKQLKRWERVIGYIAIAGSSLLAIPLVWFGFARVDYLP